MFNFTVYWFPSPTLLSLPFPPFPCLLFSSSLFPSLSLPLLSLLLPSPPFPCLLFPSSPIPSHRSTFCPVVVMVVRFCGSWLQGDPSTTTPLREGSTRQSFPQRQLSLTRRTTVRVQQCVCVRVHTVVVSLCKVTMSTHHWLRSIPYLPQLLVRKCTYCVCWHSDSIFGNSTYAFCTIKFVS